MMVDNTPLLERLCGCGEKIKNHDKHQLEICCDIFGMIINNLRITLGGYIKDDK
jgi:hypothetical protein